MPATRVCSRCREEKPLSKEYFHAKRDALGGRSYVCRPCATIVSREWRQANPYKDKAWRKAWNKKWKEENRINRRDAETSRTYGAPRGDYIRRLGEQGNRCAICDRAPGESGGRPLGMDHDHISGKIRALLCNQCNSGIGMLGDNPALVRKALAYLELHESVGFERNTKRRDQAA